MLALSQEIGTEQAEMSDFSREGRRLGMFKGHWKVPTLLVRAIAILDWDTGHEAFVQGTLHFGAVKKASQ